MKDVRPGFLNADLVVASRSDLDPLAAALARAIHPIANYRHRGLYHVRFELDREPKSADVAIRAFGRALARLRPPTRRLWFKASRRDIDIGVQVLRSSASAALPISDESVRVVGKLRGRIVVSIYHENGRRRSRPNKRLELAGAVE